MRRNKKDGRKKLGFPWKIPIVYSIPYYHKDLSHTLIGADNMTTTTVCSNYSNYLKVN